MMTANQKPPAKTPGAPIGFHASPGSVLASFSTEALREELARRKRSIAPRSSIVPCDECIHFRILRDGEAADKCHPCQKGHAMSFRVPRDPLEEVWGYYRTGCRDRRRIDSQNDKEWHEGRKEPHADKINNQ